MTDAPEKSLTREERMALDADDWMETINGERVLEDEVGSAGYLHIIVLRSLFRLLDPFVVERKLGEVFGDGLTFDLGLDENGKPIELIPDVAFIRREQIPPEFDLSGHFPGAPALTIEVISPGQTVDKLQTKVKRYLQKGSEQVWVIHPLQRELHQYRHDRPGNVSVFRDEETIDAEAFFPGLKMNVAQLLG
jgi:Uma2 family endonuclease